MNKLYATLLGAIVASGTIGAASLASASEVEKSTSIYGHINRAVVVSDDGQSTTTSQTDNARSGSRIGIKAIAKSADMTVGAVVELGVTANSDLSSQTDTNTSSIVLRQSYIALANDLGTFKIGHTSVADDGTTGRSLSNTSNAGNVGDWVIGGEEFHIKGDNSTTSSGVTVGSALPVYESGRSSNINYETLSYNGFSGKVSYANQDNGALALNYAGKIDDVAVVASVAYGSRADDAIDGEWGGSVAAKHDSGINGSLSYSTSERSGISSNAGLDNPVSFGGTVGYDFNNTGVSLVYQNVADANANGDEGEIYGVLVEHSLPAYGTSLYGGIQQAKYDTVATKYDTINAAFAGVKVAF